MSGGNTVTLVFLDTCNTVVKQAKSTKIVHRKIQELQKVHLLITVDRREVEIMDFLDFISMIWIIFGKKLCNIIIDQSITSVKIAVF